MPLCPNCKRANPPGAAFCYFDGAPLPQRTGATVLQPPEFGEFVFTSGRRCRSLEEFATACREEWEDARALLRHGILGSFLVNSGRADLGRAAREAQAQVDDDVALAQFLGQLPIAPGTRLPRLAFDPRRLVVGGKIHPGDQKKVQVLIVNQGAGLLVGSLTLAEDTPWVRFADAEDAPALAIQAVKKQQVNLLIDTRGLQGGQNYSSKLTIVTNGGVAELPIRMDLGATLFSHAPFQGAATQRQLAEKMSGNPKAAVPLLENDDVRKWFHANGWNYPIAGASARGIGAVQQYFECLGLSKPPTVELSEKAMTFDCRHPGVKKGAVTLATASRKWVYGEVESTAPWLTVITPSISGSQQAVIDFEVNASQLSESRIYEATLRVRANGGRRLEMIVRANARRPKPSRLGMLASPIVAMALVFLIGRMVLAVPADLFARLIASGALVQSERDFVKWFVLSTWWVGAVIGLVSVWRRKGSFVDLCGGFVAGTGAGLASCATLGCLLLIGDAIPRRILPENSLPSLPGTLLWLVLLTISYSIWGVLAGLVLLALGSIGRRIQAVLASPLAWIALRFGAPALAEYLAPQR